MFNDVYIVNNMVPKLRQEWNSSGQPYKESLGMRMQDRRIKVYSQHRAWLSQWIGICYWFIVIHCIAWLLYPFAAFRCSLCMTCFIKRLDILGQPRHHWKFSHQKQGPPWADGEHRGTLKIQVYYYELYDWLYDI